MAKQEKLTFGSGGSGMQLDSLLEGMKIVDIEGEKGGNISSLLGDVTHLEETQEEETGGRVKEASEPAPTLSEKARGEASNNEETADLMCVR